MTEASSYELFFILVAGTQHSMQMSKHRPSHQLLLIDYCANLPNKISHAHNATLHKGTVKRLGGAEGNRLPAALELGLGAYDMGMAILVPSIELLLAYDPWR